MTPYTPPAPEVIAEAEQELASIYARLDAVRVKMGLTSLTADTSEVYRSGSYMHHGARCAHAAPFSNSLPEALAKLAADTAEVARE